LPKCLKACLAAAIAGERPVQEFAMLNDSRIKVDGLVKIHGREEPVLVVAEIGDGQIRVKRTMDGEPEDPWISEQFVKFVPKPGFEEYESR
jgi:hypothetical protein